MTPSVAIPEPAQQLPSVFGRPSLVSKAREPAHLEVARSHYRNLAVELDPVARTYWCFMQPEGRPSFTPELLQDITDMQLSIQRMFVERADEEPPIRYFVFASGLPGIYSMGGDLGLFIEKIRAGDRVALRRYAHAAIEPIYRNHVAFGTPIITMGLVQGDALGGGFECALSLDMIVAERSAKMGLPEILFNLFPGMGAYSFLSRRVGAVTTEKMITSGRIYTAEELHEMGIVDVLAEDGKGTEAVREYITENGRKYNAHRALIQARRRVNPITLGELRDVVDIWADACLGLGESDLRKMARLTAAQDRRRAAIMPIAAE
ncbi:crotonase/enoyl-CoA hydratase family protein [Inquilinus sp. Marseille-Q2685]|uniref:crotonase/enoyl-CoA hydratase family protein n=1 Tax=Inquilinus sp. Marseille-Q2685 TaxID=2866581 RepID=UPI001CE428B2|nr:crotonase/enoyl-CoA hydratase family protein [Inquilinus sp. Marseille-Q2685]